MEKAIKASDIGNKDAAFQEYLAAVENKSNTQAREIAKDMLGKEVFWNWDCKTLITMRRETVTNFQCRELVRDITTSQGVSR